MTPPWGVAHSDKSNPGLPPAENRWVAASRESPRTGATATSSTMENPALRIRWPHQLTYPSVARPNHRLNQRKNAPSGPRASFRGLSRSADSAGLKLSALKAEITTDTAMVTANCW